MLQKRGVPCYVIYWWHSIEENCILLIGSYADSSNPAPGVAVTDGLLFLKSRG